MKENTINFVTEPRQPAGRGKIARLPVGIREQLNQRLWAEGRSTLMREKLHRKAVKSTLIKVNPG